MVRFRTIDHKSHPIAQFTVPCIFVQNVLKMAQFQQIRIFLVYFTSEPLIQLGNTGNLAENLEKKAKIATNENNCRLICGQRLVRHVTLHDLYKM